MPATNAPNASDRPASSVTYASPSVTNNTLSTNSSEDLPRATMWNQRRIHFCPRNSTTPSTTVALSKAIPTSMAMSAAGWPRAGITISNGTTIKSWASSTPITSRPCGAWSSRRSTSSFESTAVDDIATAPPKANPGCQANPANMASPVTTAIVTSTWAMPKPNTILRIVNRRATENSRPIENIRKTTPNSASVLAAFTFLSSDNACGPMSKPTSR